jgi:2-dehydro-3-deoxyphosphogluconate aldolase / (4S)-4-hydroxy-2-oxoglutarate aldolase
MSLPPSVLAERVIPVARGLDATSAPGLVSALAAGGIHTIEITVEATGGLDAISSVVGGEMTVGAGTIVSVYQASQAVDAGAEFLVMPHLDSELLDWARARGVPLIPGAFTPTEIVTAWQYQPPAVKVFPAHVGGPGYVTSLLGPYPDLRVIPTGGVDGQSAGDYLATGAVAVGVGGWLTSHPELSTVTERARYLVSQVV